LDIVRRVRLFENLNKLKIFLIKFHDAGSHLGILIEILFYYCFFKEKLT